jgi:hypothetical protein
MRWKVALAALFGLLAFLLIEAAAEADPSVEGVRVDAPAGITIGDRFHYVVTLEAENGTKLGLAPGSLPSAFQQIGQPKTTSKSAGNGRNLVTFDIEMAAFSTGEITIPPLQLEFQEPGGAQGVVETPASRLLVTSVLPVDGSQPQLKDLKPQLEIGTASSLSTYAAIFAFVLVLLLVVVLLIIRSMRQKPAAVLEVVDTTEMGPEDRARAILDAAGVRFGADRDFVAYYGAIAVTIRNYLTERYGFHAFALTTVELREEMGRRGIDRWQSRLVDGLLTQCDAAVYARYMPALERAEHDLNAAFEIVEISRPKPAEEPEAAGVSA